MNFFFPIEKKKKNNNWLYTEEIQGKRNITYTVYKERPVSLLIYIFTSNLFSLAGPLALLHGIFALYNPASLWRSPWRFYVRMREALDKGEYVFNWSWQLLVQTRENEMKDDAIKGSLVERPREVGVGAI